MIFKKDYQSEMVFSKRLYSHADDVTIGNECYHISLGVVERLLAKRMTTQELTVSDILGNRVVKLELSSEQKIIITTYNCGEKETIVIY